MSHKSQADAYKCTVLLKVVDASVHLIGLQFVVKKKKEYEI